MENITRKSTGKKWAMVRQKKERGQIERWKKKDKIKCSSDKQNKKEEINCDENENAKHRYVDCSLAEQTRKENKRLKLET